ncbi:hypothetical protein KIL84_018656 [Mauremys mutica]|uniref:Uncharacterized protein n=1 Tax=Mauremys mutica TaxID=74926 RepID=A0A9D4B2M4_9SAUR|nr:hypothetical protein KIL84_018656 [Mauremys mutica]
MRRSGAGRVEAPPPPICPGRSTSRELAGRQAPGSQPRLRQAARVSTGTQPAATQIHPERGIFSVRPSSHPATPREAAPSRHLRSPGTPERHRDPLRAPSQTEPTSPDTPWELVSSKTPSREDQRDPERKRSGERASQPRAVPKPNSTRDGVEALQPAANPDTQSAAPTSLSAGRAEAHKSAPLCRQPASSYPALLPLFLQKASRNRQPGSCSSPATRCDHSAPARPPSAAAAAAAPQAWELHCWGGVCARAGERLLRRHQPVG